MKLALFKDRRHAVDTLAGDGTTARLAVFGSSAGAAASPTAPRGSEWFAPRPVRAPIVRRPITPGREAATPGVEVNVDLHVKRFQDSGVEDERYTATFRAASAAPATLLTALADTARQIERLTEEGSPNDHLVLTIAIRSVVVRERRSVE